MNDSMCRTLSILLLLLGLLVDGSDAVQITIDPQNCIQDYSIFWKVARFGPYNVCINGTMTFSWNGMHGLFQIPTIACPSNFTAPKADGYEYLAPPSNGGSFSWSVPNKTGQYWLTSQWPGDCQNGMIAEVYVTDPTSSSHRRSAAGMLLVAVVSMTVLWTLG